MAGQVIIEGFLDINLGLSAPASDHHSGVDRNSAAPRRSQNFVTITGCA